MTVFLEIFLANILSSARLCHSIRPSLTAWSNTDRFTIWIILFYFEESSLVSGDTITDTIEAGCKVASQENA